MESVEKVFIFYYKVRLESMDFIESGVRRKVLDFLLKSKAIVYGFYRTCSPQKSFSFSTQK